MVSNQYLIFQIDEQKFAIPVSNVLQIIRAVSLSELPRGPELLLGLLNVHGDIVPVFNIRKQLFRPAQPIRITDRIILVKVEDRTVAFVADYVQTVAELDVDEEDTAETIFPELEQFITAASHLNGSTVFIYDTDQLIPPAEIELIECYLQSEALI